MTRNSLTVPSLGTVSSLWKDIAFQTVGTLGTLKLEGLWTPRVLEYRSAFQVPRRGMERGTRNGVSQTRERKGKTAVQKTSRFCPDLDGDWTPTILSV
jgi:hypothetical protein